VPAGDIAPTLQRALDAWAVVKAPLEELAHRLATDAVKGEPFDEARALAPLPRAFQWADGSAYVNHVALVRQARGATLPDSFWTDPLMYQGGSDTFLAPRAPIRLADDAWGIDFEAEVAVITDDVPMGTARERAGYHVKLFALVNDVSLRNLIPGELAKGFGFFHGKPSSAFAPVAVTPDELGPAWRDGKIHLPLLSFVNGQPFGRPDAGVDMTFDFATLIAHAARTRPLGAGTIIGSGTVSNRAADGGPGRPIAAGGLGYSCVAEQRMVETIQDGAPRTPFLSFGDRVRIEMRDAAGASVFGAIDQVIERYGGG
jgi:fumarylacetoacetate (FAA) hydrolase